MHKAETVKANPNLVFLCFLMFLCLVKIQKEFRNNYSILWDAGFHYKCHRSPWLGSEGCNDGILNDFNPLKLLLLLFHNFFAKYNELVINRLLSSANFLLRYCASLKNLEKYFWNYMLLHYMNILFCVICFHCVTMYFCFIYCPLTWLLWSSFR